MEANNILEVIKGLEKLSSLCKDVDAARRELMKFCNPYYDEDEGGYSGTSWHDRDPMRYEDVPAETITLLQKACAAFSAAVTEQFLDSIVYRDAMDWGDTAQDKLRDVVEAVTSRTRDIMAAILGDQVLKHYEETYDAVNVRYSLSYPSLAAMLAAGIKEFRQDRTIKKALADHARVLMESATTSVATTEGDLTDTDDAGTNEDVIRFAQYQAVKAMVIRAVRAGELAHRVAYDKSATSDDHDLAIVCLNEVKEFIAAGVLDETTWLFSECEQSIHHQWTRTQMDRYQLSGFATSIDQLLVAASTNRYSSGGEWAKRAEAAGIGILEGHLLNFEKRMAKMLVKRLDEVPKLPSLFDHLYRHHHHRSDNDTDHWLAVAHWISETRQSQQAEATAEVLAVIADMEVEEPGESGSEPEVVEVVPPEIVEVAPAVDPLVPVEENSPTPVAISDHPPPVGAASPLIVKPDGPRPLNEFWLKGVKASLQPKPYELVSFLWEQRDRAANVDDVCLAVWQDEEAAGSALKSTQSKANRSFEEAELPCRIERSGKVIALIFNDETGSGIN